MSAKRVNKITFQVLMLIAVLIILFLSATNIRSYFTPVKVLGIESSEESDTLFWEKFLKNNPEYIPGWLEIGRIDKANEIDPNYIIP
jgi:hypothetical protein